MQNPGANRGLLSLFGVTRRDPDWLTGFLRDRLGIVPTVVTYPNNESCFYYTNQGEVRENGSSTYLKLGFLRSPEAQPLAIDEDGDDRFAPDRFETGSISGNGHLVRFDRREPGLAVFPTFMATSQVYYMPWEGGVLCATDMRVMLRLVDEVSLNEKALPLHLMYRIAPGPMTHFKDILRVFPGEILCWRNGALEVKHVPDMFCPPERPAYDHLDGAQCGDYFEKLSRIMGSYAREIEGRKGEIGNELSGGVDSAVIQVLIGQHTPQNESPRSFSLTWEATGFQFEVGYARVASEVLHTEHTFLDMHDKDYIALLVRAVETMAQPNLKAENDPGQLALAEHIAANYPQMHMFMGMGGDAFYGIDIDNVEAANNSNWRKRLPGHYFVTESVRLFGTPLFRKKLGGVPDVVRYACMPASYRCLRTPAGFFDPVNSAGIPYTTIETVRHFLGDRVVLDALDYRRRVTQGAMTSHCVLEQMHDISALAAAYNTSASFQTFFSSVGLVMVPFYYDQDMIRLVKSVSPQVRYVKGTELKPILKDILRQKSAGRIIHEKKGSSGFWRDFQSWMMTGSLREMVHSIERPGFMNQKDFGRLINNKHPYGYDLVFPLLTYDIFKKSTARNYGRRA